MDAKQINAFIDAMAASNLGEMEVSHEGWTLRLARGALSSRPAVAAPTRPQHTASAEALATPAAAARSHELLSPMYGIVHLQPAPGEPVFARVGDPVQAGQLLCVIEAMKVFNEVRAEQGGRLARVLVPTGTEVEAGQALMAIEPAA